MKPTWATLIKKCNIHSETCQNWRPACNFRDIIWVTLAFTTVAFIYQNKSAVRVYKKMTMFGWQAEQNETNLSYLYKKKCNIHSEACQNWRLACTYFECFLNWNLNNGNKRLLLFFRAYMQAKLKWLLKNVYQKSTEKFRQPLMHELRIDIRGFGLDFTKSIQRWNS